MFKAFEKPKAPNAAKAKNDNERRLRTTTSLRTNCKIATFVFYGEKDG